MKRSTSSIRRQLLAWLLIPLCGLCLCASAVAYQMAAAFASDAYDGQLVNSAAAVAARLRFDGVQVSVDLPPAAQAILRHNSNDKLYYQVLELDDKEFEILVGHLLTALGFEGSEVTGKTGDGGVDATGELNIANLAKVKIFVQAKRYKKGQKIAPGIVRQLRQAI
ncbi:MAG TPA: sensor histidine kinase N-terminal domain-containing protein, partial [Candidatus Obscuribacter sp.]|nr:sensor histidine kinase N-terminal domain-containing protein [Candidatus Obscuribacter sp.]